MVSWIALLLCLGGMFYLFRQEIASEREFASGALWVPLIWMFLAGSRWASSWLSLGQPFDSVNAYSEGSPVDRAVFFCLIAAGLVILARRNIDWGAIVSQNKLLLFYFAYCLLSLAWADDSFVGFKRWFKDLGNPIMALVILTEADPKRAIAIVLRRLAYLLLPLSLLFIRYFPDLGRVYHFDGSPMYTGAGHQKNDLGLMCLVTGTYCLWQILQERERFLKWSRAERFRIYLLLAMMAWLLRMSDSQTSLSCLLITAAVLVLGRMSIIQEKPSRVMVILISAGVVYGTLEAGFGIRREILEWLGRDPSLTNRTMLWGVLLNIQSRPEFGYGFMSFWQGSRLELVARLMGATVNQAHSGYLEQYLNLGYVGVALVVLLMLQGLVSAWSVLNTDTSMAMLRICLLFSAAFYNYTEASFYGINNMWVLTLIAVINRPVIDRLPAMHKAIQRTRRKPSLERSHGSRQPMMRTRREGR